MYGCCVSKSLPHAGESEPLTRNSEEIDPLAIPGVVYPARDEAYSSTFVTQVNFFDQAAEYAQCPIAQVKQLVKQHHAGMADAAQAKREREFMQQHHRNLNLFGEQADDRQECGSDWAGREAVEEPKAAPKAMPHGHGIKRGAEQASGSLLAHGEGNYPPTQGNCAPKTQIWTDIANGTEQMLAQRTAPGPSDRVRLHSPHAGRLHSPYSLQDNAAEVTPSSVAVHGEWNSSLKQSWSTEPVADADLALGDIVKVLNSNSQGVVRFVGHTSLSTSHYLGIELDDPIGENDGSLDGTQYFQCEPNHGVFVRPDAVLLIEESPDAIAGWVVGGKGLRCHSRDMI